MKRELMAVLPVLFGCASGLQEPGPEIVETVINIVTEERVRSSDPDEYLLSDFNVYIFDSYGTLVHKCYIGPASYGELPSGGRTLLKTGLLENVSYSVYVCANLGYEPDIDTFEELGSFRYYLAYPDDYRAGVPMSGCVKDFVASDGKTVEVVLRRMMSKISVCIDRSRLDSDVEFHVKSLKICGCPKSALLFGDSRVEGPGDVFASGFYKSDDGVEALNDGNAVSAPVSVYMLENLQGNLLEGNDDYKSKYFEDGDPRAGKCSYIELRAEYVSSGNYSAPGKYLVYRFYLGESPENFDVRRNCHYKVTLMPAGSGLSGDGWRVDKEGIAEYIREIRLSYTSLQFTYIGESIGLKAYVEPEQDGANVLEWYSDNTSVAEVSEAGTVVCKGQGDCTVTAAATDGSGVKAECSVSVRIGEPYMKLSPGNYIECGVGDEIHVRCEYFPPSAPFSIGREELEEDRRRGIYDYSIDDDGKGVVLSIKKKGSGLLYMEAGEPVNQSELVVLVVV